MAGKIVRAEVEALTEEVRALRAELAALREAQAAHLGNGHGWTTFYAPAAPIPAAQPFPPFTITCDTPVSFMGIAPGAAGAAGGMSTTCFLNTTGAAN